jgi:predicted unusual protein kinase regulating ubiquinone biosynthesis (AarF/ABC1/UbiB family)
MRRFVVLGGIVATAIALRARRSRPASGTALSSSGRAARTAAVTGLSTKLGTTWALHRARRTFTSAGRREELDRTFELTTAEEVAAVLGNMKGALMKLGQMASYLDDGLPEPVREALASLQQDAPPMSPGLAAQVVETELGGPPDQIFDTWDEHPLASASIGQVHRAITRDGRAVAVKVQFPGVDRAIRSDLANTDVLMSMMGLLFPGLETGPLVAELRSRLLEELDYHLEAANQRLFADWYRGHPFVHVPDVVDELCTRRVLTTDLANGARFGEVASSWSQSERDLAGEAIYRFVFRSLYRFEAFNGDPHPGNYLFNPGGRVTFLDFGLVKRFRSQEVAVFADMVRALCFDHDPGRYRQLLEAANVLKRGADMTDADVLDYFGYFYEPVLDDKVMTLTHEYSSQALSKVFSRTGEVSKFGNVPPAFVIIQRINMGLFSVLASLHATANWRRIAEELWPWVDGPPSTSLGKEEGAWVRSKGKGQPVGTGSPPR